MFISHEWELDPQTCDILFYRWGFPDVDLFATQQNKVSAQEGILHVFKNSDTQLTKEYCIYYNRNWSTLPSTLNNIVYTKLAFLTPKLLCSQSDVPQADIIKDKAIVVMRGNCTFLEKAEIAQHFHAKMLLIASETPIHIPFGNKNQSINIPIALIRNEDIIDLKQTLGKNVSVALYSPPVPDYFYSVVLIFLIAVLCVILGGYWSGMVELEKLKSAPNSESSTSLSSVENVTLTPVTAVLFVCISCVMLVLMYYFYKWLVYVVISLFCVASATSLFNCLSVLVEKIPYGQCRFPCWHQCIKVRLFFLALFCIAASVTWAVFRNEDSWAWILQDILGIAFCVNLIKTLKVPNFKGVDQIVLVRPRSQMDPDGFLKALGDFPVDKAGDPVDALVELWNGEMTRAIDMIAPKCPLPPGRAYSSPWYTPELQAMKQVGRHLERRWRRSRGESDRTHLRAHYRAYAVAVRMAKKKFFSASIAFSQCHLAELFRVVQGLIHPGPKKDHIPPSKAHCDDFARHFREKIAQIRHELDSTIEPDSTEEMPMTPSSPQLMDEFQLLWPDDVDKVLGQVRLPPAY
ncbi:Signal peptide peptidase-like 2A [Varanus komodoensis]|nr:Signal peptide peptidase-like 2A [Varanus komodoensis]